jgi:ubiquinone/menaquinone biosynthesis C-methylase UbiE
MSFEKGTNLYARRAGRYTDALAAAARTGAERVAGIDRSRPFVEMARRRVPGENIRAGVAEALPFDDKAFDVVTSQLVVKFMDDVHAGVAEMRRVAGRTVASCVWDYSGEMREALRRACHRRLGRPAGPFDLRARTWVAAGQI